MERVLLLQRLRPLGRRRALHPHRRAPQRGHDRRGAVGVAAGRPHGPRAGRARAARDDRRRPRRRGRQLQRRRPHAHVAADRRRRGRGQGGRRGSPRTGRPARLRLGLGRVADPAHRHRRPRAHRPQRRHRGGHRPERGQGSPRAGRPLVRDHHLRRRDDHAPAGHHPGANGTVVGPPALGRAADVAVVPPINIDDDTHFEGIIRTLQR